MRVNLDTSELSTGLKVISKGAAKILGETSPVNMLRLMTMSNGELVVTSTNLDVSMTTTLKCEILDPGGVLIPQKAVADVGYLDDISVQVFSTKNSVGFQTASSTSSFPAIIDITQFPSFPTPRSEGFFQLFFISTDTLLKIIAGTTFIADEDNDFESKEGKVAYSALLIAPYGESDIDFVTADSFHMAHYRHHTTVHELKKRVLVPAKGLALIKHILKPDTVTTVYASEQMNVLIFEDDYGNQLAIRTLDAVFPNYMTGFPEEYVAETTIETIPFRKACERSVLYKDTNAVTHNVELSMGRGKERNLFMQIPETHNQEGFAVMLRAIPMEYTSELQPVSRLFLSEYLKGIAKAITTDTVTVRFGAGNRGALVIRPTEEAFTYIMTASVNAKGYYHGD